MSRERLLSITMMVVGVTMIAGAILWFWLWPRPMSVEGIPETRDPTWMMGSVFIGLIVAAVGASTYE